MAKINNKIENIYSLTPLQGGMLYHNIYDLNSTAYVLQNVITLDYNMDSKYLTEALSLLSKRYSVLRTSFIYEGVKDIYQVVLRERVPEIKEYDFSNLENEAKEEEINKVINDDLNRGFDLKNDTLLRLIHIKYSEGVDKLIMTMHHIIIDGWCQKKLLVVLCDYYSQLSKGRNYIQLENEINYEKSISNDYEEYIKWLLKQNKEKAKRYWKDELEGYDNDSDIKPINKPEFTKDQMREIFGELSAEKTKALKATAGKCESTINTLAETAVGIMLQGYTRSNDVVFGKVVSGRNADIHGIENMIGLFINTIPVRVTADKEETISELIKKQQRKGVESTDFDYYSLVDIQKTTVQGSELIKILYVFENYDSNPQEDKLADLGVKDVSAREQTNYGITIVGFEMNKKLYFKIMYDPNKYCNDEVKLILARLLKICEEIANKPDCKICELVTLTSEEKHLILNDFNATETEYPREKTIVELFEEQVKKTSDNIAVVFEDKMLTYAELNVRANSLAYKLRELGVEPDDFVAIIAERSIEMICGIYGIIKAGGAYIPIDLAYPDDRIAFMLEDCKPKVILKYTTDNITISNEIPVINLADGQVWEGVSENPKTVNKPEDLLYCIYTSGTTGKPKGVMLQNSSVVNYCYNQSYSVMDYAYKNNLKTILSVTNMVFDIFVTELHLALINGYKIVLASSVEQVNPDKLSELINKYKPDIMQTTPSRVKMLLSNNIKENGMNQLKYIMLGGEKVERELVNRLRTTTSAVIENVYGPTETTVWSTCCEVDNGAGQVSIGKPISNTQIYILNGDNLCGIGVPGELCIAGDGLARGYLNRPDLTAEKFVKNPFGEGRMYRTGDLARWLPDGNIDFLGRVDEQVKIRGFRIELGEIESRIREIENIKDCAVIAKADPSGDQAIYAYYTSDSELSVSNIRDRLSDYLPDYMLPAYMMQIDEIPVTRNGKLDRRALPEIERKSEREYIAPRNKAEEAICAAFCEIMNLEKIGVQDNFLEFGGDSIKAIRIISKLRDLGYNVAVKDIMTGKTPEKIALYVKNIDEEGKHELSKYSSKTTNDNIDNNKSNIKITSDLFFLKNTIDENLAEYNCEDIASEYVKSITESEIINLYNPSYTQKHFFEIDNNEIFSKLSVYNTNSDEVISILNELIRTQEIFRTAYDGNIDKMIVYDYSQIEIPILNDINYKEWISSIYTTYKGEFLNKGGLLSRIFVVKNHYNQFDVYMIYHHGITDITSVLAVPELLTNIANGNKDSYLPKRSFSEVIDIKKKLSENNESKIKVEGFKKTLEKFNNALRNQNYKYAYIDMEKKCSKAEIDAINDNQVKWLIGTMLDLWPDELCDNIENQLPFIFIHSGRTSYDYSTLGMFLSLMIGSYNTENGIDSIIKEIADYQSKDQDIPDHLEALDDQILLKMNIVPIINVHSTRPDFKVEKESLMVTKIDEFITGTMFIINNDQIYARIPIVYKNMDDLERKIFSSLKMKVDSVKDRKLLQRGNRYHY